MHEERNFYAVKGVKFNFVPIREGKHYPTDFVTEQDVTLGLKVLYNTVVGLKRKGYHIHLSISGGRKVMTAMGMVVAQLLLDENDHVWHLLSEGFVLQSKTMHSPNPKKVVLIPVPVLRWSLLPSTLNELLIWDDPCQAIERQKRIQQLRAQSR
ncbi:MAG: CRISPR-associated ring nuclease [Candidatus Fervidibacter sp.]|uniref:CRISPR-associated ring nuclease n=1 Tax=Candidatus Fervidibacter sp. TaxID=3100871 RepID=UPI00404935B2